VAQGAGVLPNIPAITGPETYNLSQVLQEVKKNAQQSSERLTVEIAHDLDRAKIAAGGIIKFFCNSPVLAARRGLHPLRTMFALFGGKTFYSELGLRRGQVHQLHLPRTGAKLLPTADFRG
jgi:hypothetical protein